MRSVQRRSRKSGLPPGSLVYVGEDRDTARSVKLFHYDEEHCTETVIEELGQLSKLCCSSGISWINIEGVQNAQQIESIGDHFQLHPLLLEDIMNTDQRPKIEDFEQYVFLVLKMLSLDPKRGELRSEQVSFVLGNNYLLTFQEGLPGDVFNGVRERLQNNKGRLRKEGADMLAYSLLDAIIDEYFVILESAAERVEALEDRLLTSAEPQLVKDLHRLKRDVLFLRRSIWPLREVISRMTRGEYQLIQTAAVPYFRDLYDHVIQVIDSLENFRDSLSNMMDIYLSIINNRMNEVIKVLTIIATIFIPLTFIVGLYGMNFKYMPELEWHWGYFSVLGFMALCVVFMLAYFRKKHWL
jgi:magnesium transporter